MLRMHFVVRDIFLFYRTKGSEPHVQSYKSHLDAFIPDSLQQLRRKMQPCRGRGSGPQFP